MIVKRHVCTYVCMPCWVVSLFPMRYLPCLLCLPFPNGWSPLPDGLPVPFPLHLSPFPCFASTLSVGCLPLFLPLLSLPLLVFFPSCLLSLSTYSPARYLALSPAQSFSLLTPIPFYLPVYFPPPCYLSYVLRHIPLITPSTWLPLFAFLFLVPSRFLTFVVLPPLP